MQNTIQIIREPLGVNVSELAPGTMYYWNTDTIYMKLDTGRSVSLKNGAVYNTEGSKNVEVVPPNSVISIKAGR